MSRCAFCGAARGEGAGPCPACGEAAPGPARRWWQSNATVIVALAVLGPFALPLVWANPRYKVATKLVLTVMVVAVSIWAVLFTRALVARLTDLLSAAGS